MTKIFLVLVLVLKLLSFETVDKQNIGIEVFDNLDKVKCLGSAKMISYLESTRKFTTNEDEDIPLKVKSIYRLNQNGREELKIDILDSGYSITTDSPEIYERIKRNGKFLEDESSDISFAEIYKLDGEVYYITNYKQQERKYYWISSGCKK